MLRVHVSSDDQHCCKRPAATATTISATALSSLLVLICVVGQFPYAWRRF
ncbi:hypothetical protein [Arthrobacter sp. NamB2]|nr:hypothetical protein [Arthrobacter sp. NamB2]